MKILLGAGIAILLFGPLFVYADYLLRKGVAYALGVWLSLSLIVWLAYLYGLFRLCLYLFGL